MSRRPLTRREHWAGRAALLVIGVGFYLAPGLWAVCFYVGILMLVGLATIREKSL